MESKVAQAVLDRAEGMCEETKTARGGRSRRCGSPHWLEIHHVVYKSQGGKDELDNLMLLCKLCHMRRHHLR